MNGIVWLASYPKSGNTWFRVFLANLLAGSDIPADINSLNTTSFSGRLWFDEAAGWETSDLTKRETDQLRADVQITIARLPEPTFFKVHEAFTHPADNRPLFSLEATRAALYFIRNPLDLAISFSLHRGKSLDDTIDFMNCPSAALADKTDHLGTQMPQPLRDWSGHVRSWTDVPGLHMLILRYEDMRQRPQEIFTSACQHLGLQNDPASVARALGHSRIEELQKQERERGFIEARSGQTFFSKGRVGEWRNVLSKNQVASIVEHHGEIMRRFGYLNSDGSLPG